MDTIKCLVVDDEPIGRLVMENFIKQVPFLELVAVVEDAFDALNILETHPVDLLLSDIQMPHINGLEFVKSLPSPPVIIFITAHDQFAVNSYELGAVDYLLKPVLFERFLKAVNKARTQVEVQKSTPKVPSEDRIGYFFIKANNKLNKLRFDDIWYIEAIKDYIKMHTKQGLLVTHSSMKGIEEKLPAGDFIRIHNSYIISVKAVKAVDTNSVELLNDTTLPVSKSRKDDLFSALNINEG